MNSWWNSTSGTKFQSIVNGATLASLKSPIKTEVSQAQMLGFIVSNAEVDSSVVKKWINGSNPSIINVSKILTACGCNRKEVESIVNSLRATKRPDEKVAEVSRETEELRAIIQFSDDPTRWWVRTYDKNNKFIYGDRVGVYGYAFNIIHSPKYLTKVVEKLGHNNFNITIDEKLSVPRPAHEMAK